MINFIGDIGGCCVVNGGNICDVFKSFIIVARCCLDNVFSLPDNVNRFLPKLNYFSTKYDKYDKHKSKKKYILSSMFSSCTKLQTIQ